MQIIKFSRGGIGLKDIQTLPYSQYKIIRKAAELEEVRERISRIADMNAAFSGNKKHVDTLEKQFQEIFGNKNMLKPLEQATPDPDWQSRLNRFKR